MPQDKKSQVGGARAVFLGGVVKADGISTIKPGDLPRFVFAGRSNVGKSSLLNALTGMKVARVSAQPGKTREMNFYRFAATRDPRDLCLLVDLPGYGYAKVASELKKQWGQEITTWLKGDEFIRLIITLVDGRHGFLNNDVELVEFLRASGLPFVVAFTKMDKYKSANQKRNAERELAQVAAKLGVEHFIFVSAMDRAGIVPLEKTIREALAAQ